MKIFISLFASILLLSGCDTNPEVGAPPAFFGNAVRQNIAAQIVNPDAPETDAPLDYAGDRITIGHKRYATDNVEKPEAITTSDQEASGGGK